MTKRYVAILGSVFILVIGIILSSAIQAAASKGRLATLEDFKGEVMIKNAGAWAKPELGMVLYSGAKIVTKEGSAQILFNDGATMQVDPFSSIRTIDQYLKGAEVKNGKSRVRKIRIMLGRAKYEEQPIPERETRIELPTAVAALRGTGGWFGADEAQNSAGKLYEGSMEQFGDFQEIIPKILDLARALNSSTFQASLASSSAADNPLLNVREIQSEVQTFEANTDPQVNAAISEVIKVITPVLNDIQAKLEKAQKAEQTKAGIPAADGEAPLQQAKVQEKAKESADDFISAAQSAANADIVYVLETLKGDEEGQALALAVKGQNESALGVAESALDVSGKALELAQKAQTPEQLDTALAVASTAANTVKTVAKSVDASNAAALLTARDDEAGAQKAAQVYESTGKGLATAQKSSELAAKALATAETNAELALTVAKAAETSSAAAKNTSLVGSKAAEAITQGADDAESLIEATETAAESVEAAEEAVEILDEAIETGNEGAVQDAVETINEAESSTSTQVQETGADEAADNAAIEEGDEAADDEAVEGEDEAAGDEVVEEGDETPAEPEAFEEAEDEADEGDQETTVTPEAVEAPELPPTQDDQAASPI